MSLGAKKSEIHAEFFVTRLGCEPLNAPRLSCVPGAVRSVAVGGGSGPSGGGLGWGRVPRRAPGSGLPLRDDLQGCADTGCTEGPQPLMRSVAQTPCGVLWDQT